MLTGGRRYEGRSVPSGPWLGRPGQLQIVEEMPTGSFTVGRRHLSQSPHTAHSGAAKNIPTASTSLSSPNNPLPTVLAAGGRWPEMAWPRARGGGRGPGVPVAPLGTATQAAPKPCLRA